MRRLSGLLRRPGASDGDRPTEISSIPWEADGEFFAGEAVLWATDFQGAQVTAIDPTTGEILDVLATVRFPVAPIAAFGHAWLPSSTDGNVSIIDEATLGQITNLVIPVTDGRQKDITAIPGGATGNEVWVRNNEGGYASVSAEPDTLGEVTQLEIERSINRLHPIGDRILMLPTWGQAVYVADVKTAEIIAEIPIEAIPYRAVVDGDQAWVTSDGGFEGLFHIDLQTLTIVESFQVGENLSNTTGPTHPFLVDSEVWVPNRGDSKLFVVTRPGN